MNVLVALNYQREIPPFMLTELRCAAQQFDKVYYVTREFEYDNSGLLEEKNICIVQMKRRHRIRTLLELPYLLFRSEIIFEFVQGIKTGTLPKQYLRHVGKELYCTQNLYHAAMPVLATHRKSDSICVQATWFDVCAYAATKLKKKMPEIKVVSLAHAFEINPARSNFVGYSCDHFKLKRLDAVYFIADEMRKIYINALPRWIHYSSDKLKIRYLGSQKKYAPVVRDNTDAFTLCSCSGVNALKRVDLIVEALTLWKGRKIHWIHIGDGELMDEIRQRAVKSLSEKDNVEYTFMGKLENRDVQKFYAEHNVDLFLNVSSSEGLPISIMEAMSYGIPVLATDVGATSEIVCYKDENMLLPKDITPQVLCDRIATVSRWTEEKHSRLSQSSLHIWETKFNADIAAKSYYKSLREKNDQKRL